MTEFTHFNDQGRAKMVDTTDKQETVRVAKARSSVTVSKQVYDQIIEGTNKKGDVFAVSQVAGIMGAKNTPDIIPMCHPLLLNGVDITFEWEITEDKQYTIIITSEVKVKGSTGVEMEALTAASAAALTIYDMCKAVDKGMVIGPTYLLKKTGGKNGNYERE
ncbi:cyclic pyranopterin monophosphate synthase subunit MoaC [Alteribacillus persepolensis]|uniref:Cyclic pyranopterin monophosphate synthase n=1 Tax=Alteribacillus persepolensis TaxID=568899 RepID=A0A1G8FMJ6_9BACI|nr:cyclic pyranopterin monophosphate synthase MoaC [Alteribacillus persepolensis]SDH83216.1 cyclic pyranopterin monophosphate synthase subunit MoaC [Alteribacillus persepolensis]